MRGSPVRLADMRRTLALALISTAAMAQNMFHGDAAHSGVYAGPGPRSGKVKWAFKAGGPIVTSPAVAAGVIYFGALDGHLHAVSQDTGQEKWKFKSKMPIASSPAGAGGGVFFVSFPRALPPPHRQNREPKRGV